ncbi:MAG: efflux RND transporter periplasmic adaptor subunit [Tannerella sp.]|jgi:multidrug efflux pump subunit AcrA (membrane-fusion protein)|nr:efflux RND transporter periplasmic adaptor subunit [Tannerella sp.]
MKKNQHIISLSPTSLLKRGASSDFLPLRGGLGWGFRSRGLRSRGFAIRAFSFSFILILLLLASCGKSGDSDLAGRGSGGAVVIETGTLEAINNKLFILPRYSMYWYEMRIVGLAENGTMVNEGDSIIQVDPAEVNKFIIERETYLETEYANLEKMQVQQSNQISEMESKIKNETAAFNLKKIELESSRFETERQQKIKQLEFKQAELNLAKEKRKLELTRIIIDNDTKIQQIRIRQIENDLEHFYRILPELTVRSSVAGVFQRGRNMRTGQPLVLGDMMYCGYSMGNVPELKWMKVNTFVNENDFLKLQVGQKVIVRLDALPEIKFDGEVSYVGKLCRLKEEKSKQKGFDVEVKMLEPDERLKPGMTVSCEFQTTNQQLNN